jgi:cysteinyl-tRNA synthetase
LDIDVDGGEYEQRFTAAMDDDFNTPGALAIMFELRNRLNTASDDVQVLYFASLLKKLGGLLGILQNNPESHRKGLIRVVKTSTMVWNIEDAETGLAETDIEDLIEQRNQARADKNWAESDRIRDELDAQGIVLEDKAGKTSWRRK